MTHNEVEALLKRLKSVLFQVVNKVIAIWRLLNYYIVSYATLYSSQFGTQPFDVAILDLIKKFEFISFHVLQPNNIEAKTSLAWSILE